jgi:hypothetical protein
MTINVDQARDAAILLFTMLPSQERLPVIINAAIRSEREPDMLCAALGHCGALIAMSLCSRESKLALAAFYEKLARRLREGGEGTSKCH